MFCYFLNQCYVIVILNIHTKSKFSLNKVPKSLAYTYYDVSYTSKYNRYVT